MQCDFLSLVHYHIFVFLLQRIFRYRSTCSFCTELGISIVYFARTHTSCLQHILHLHSHTTVFFCLNRHSSLSEPLHQQTTMKPPPITGILLSQIQHVFRNFFIGSPPHTGIPLQDGCSFFIPDENGALQMSDCARYLVSRPKANGTQGQGQSQNSISENTSVLVPTKSVPSISGLPHLPIILVLSLILTLAISLIFSQLALRDERKRYLQHLAGLLQKLDTALAAQAAAKEKVRLQEAKIKLQEAKLRIIQVEVMRVRDLAERVKGRVAGLGDVAEKTGDEMSWMKEIEKEGDDQVKGWMLEDLEKGVEGDDGADGLSDDDVGTLAEIPEEAVADTDEEECETEVSDIDGEGDGGVAITDFVGEKEEMTVSDVDVMDKELRQSPTDAEIRDLVVSAEAIFETCRALEEQRRKKREREVLDRLVGYVESL